MFILNAHSHHHATGPIHLSHMPTWHCMQGAQKGFDLIGTAFGAVGQRQHGIDDIVKPAAGVSAQRDEITARAVCRVVKLVWGLDRSEAYSR